jgi:hypothetical protein
MFDGVSVTYNFQTGTKKNNSAYGIWIWQLCTRRIDVWEKIWHRTSKWRLFYFVVSGLKIIGHGNLDNNLESSCI